MRGLVAFTKKEIVEQFRTYRVLIMLSVFFLFGMMSPLLAKLLPEILSGMDIQGITLIIPEPVALDAYSQFFQNMNEMGIIVILLVFGGVISNELMKGTLINILAKGLNRHTVILAKYIAALALWTVSYVLAGVVNQGYTVYLFDTSSISNLVFSLFCMWLFGAFVLALIFLSSTLTGGSFSGLILTAVVLGGLLVANMFPAIEKINPIYLSSRYMELLTGTVEPSAFATPVWVTAILSVGCLYAAVILFNKRKL